MQCLLFSAPHLHCDVSSSPGPQLLLEVFSSLGLTLPGKVSPLEKLKYHAMHTPLGSMKKQVFEATPIQDRHLFLSTLARYTQKNEPPMSWSPHFNDSGSSKNMVVLSE